MKKQGQEVPFPGVDNSQGRGSLTIKHTKYYQWVAFTLFFQVSTENHFFTHIFWFRRARKVRQTFCVWRWNVQLNFFFFSSLVKWKKKISQNINHEWSPLICLREDVWGKRQGKAVFDTDVMQSFKATLQPLVWPRTVKLRNHVGCQWRRKKKKERENVCRVMMERRFNEFIVI